MNRLQHYLAIILSVSLINAVVLQSAQAAMVSTEEVASQVAGQSGSGQARLAAALARSDVRAEMERQGVDPAVAVERIAALTDDEASRLADQIETAPAGGNILGVIVFVFLVLVVTDILGFTKIFPFTRSVR